MTQVGVVSEIHRFPVKSMLGEALTGASLGPKGLDGDRAHALVDQETGRVVSVKRPNRWGRIFELRATTGPDGVAVTFPDGEVLSVGDAELEARLSDLFGRVVTVEAMPPPGATFDELWLRELKEDADPYFGQPSRVEDGEELVDAGGFMSAMGTFFNFGAVHLVTTGTTRALSAAEPTSRFDARRFRPNVVIETPDDGFVETAWRGRAVRIGDVELAVTFTVPRCVMTTLAQDDLPADRKVLQTITARNPVDVFSTGVGYPCVGVYADVTGPGDIRVGDEVHLIDG